LQLPDNSIGISDIEAYRECARRMSFGMRRHTGPGEQDDSRTPEAAVSGAVWARGYGSAVHELLHEVEDGWDDDSAVQRAWNRYGRYLEPEDIDLLRDDLAIYRNRDLPNTRLVVAEEDLRVPLLIHNGEQIYFRCRLDRLYERLDAPGTYVHIDYKSSKWAKSAAEVQSDRQLWSYNWAIHEYFPECDRLVQIYDQLRYGQETTRKTDDQRRQIRDWLVAQVTTILEDRDWQPDGLLVPTFNEWCPWCPIMESCPVVPQLTTWAATRIATLAPERPKLKQDGTESKRMEKVPLDPAMIEQYTAELAKSIRAVQVLERYNEQVKALLRDMPADERQALGFDLRHRANTAFTSEAARMLHDRLGDRFYELVKLTKTAIEEQLVESPELRAWALALAEPRASTPLIVARKDAA
jgi:hypothetical protein